MGTHVRGEEAFLLGEAMSQQICHLDRSEAEWRDLRCQLVLTQTLKPILF
jgi:hypothetical protein